MAAARGLAQPATEADPWPSLAAQIFDDGTLQDGETVLAIEAPYRAEDAAVVPLSLRLLAADVGQVRKITLVIDQNPSPLAAIFSLGPNSGIRMFSTRVRIDSYTKIHAVAEMTSGERYVVERFVKAAGGCSAPPAKEMAGGIPLGTMRFRQFPPDSGSDLRQAQLMVRHPNYSGMQMDQVTRLYVPAHFISAVRLWQGSDLLLSIESGISISENPEFRFSYRPNGATLFRAEAQDNQGNNFAEQWPATRA
jgi:sulfur-oxidizing protein SoxY